MAKKAARNSNGAGKPERGVKSSAIREYFASNRDAKPKEVIEALKAKGIEVSPNMVSIVKAKAGIKKAKRQARKAVANKDATAGAQSSKSAGLDAALVLYKAARGQETSQAKITSSFLALVELLS